MQKISIISTLMLLAMALGACSGSDSASDITGTDNGLPDTISTDGKTLVVYFSKTLPAGLDNVTGATDIVRDNGNDYGANQYLALMIARDLDADTLRLTVAADHYPLAYNDLASYARQERDQNSHPALTSRHVDMSDYTNIIIGTPIWWYTIPMPVYSFLDAYDLSGKNIFVYTTHAGSGLADALSVIRREEPRANVSSTALSVRASNVSASTSTHVNQWLEQTGLRK